MNIFFLSKDPVEAARLQCDKHVVKMILESCQLLSTAKAEFGYPTTYRPTHRNHPSAVWVRESKDHYLWLMAHCQALLAEYTRRYGKAHRSAEALNLELLEPPEELGDGWRDPPQCMPEEFQCEDTVKAYRRYYQWKSTQMNMTWKN